ncbi:MAG: LytTR family transcriptional regulator, partial [candidate division Zixibacteria bacterium]|nr:LytTR family transcriptional regulator [candidate division Zixibacteria bacterium]
ASQYAQIHANGRTYLVSKPLSWYERELDPSIFVRIHRRHLVNVAQIKSYAKQRGQGYAVVLKDDTILEISRRRVGALKSLLEIN